MTTTLDIPHIAQITLPMTSSTAGQAQTFRLADYLGQTVVLFFYPKDSTPGCTTESMAFRDHYAEFTACGAQVFGLSRDSLKSHDKFKANLALPYELISDNEEHYCQAFGVIKDKMMYGKKVRGIERSTFIFDASGQLVHEWRKVKVEQHVSEVLSVVQTLNPTTTNAV